MKNRISNRKSKIIPLIAACVTLAAAIDSAQAQPPVQYMVVELGGRRANDISQSGQIVGNKVFTSGLRHAAFWPTTMSAPIDLGTLSDLSSSVAEAMNPRREIVGSAFNEDESGERPVFWASPNSAPVELPGLPAGLLGIALDINPSGQIVGQFYSEDFSVVQAVFWPSSNAAPVYLPQLSENFPFSTTAGINASGNILGDGCAADFIECHATFWATSTSTPVALASPGGELIYTDVIVPGNINGPGNMVGLARNADFSAARAVFWASSSSPAVILSTVGEFTNGFANGINDKGQIVGIGISEDFSRIRAFLWPSATSEVIDLTTFFPAGSDWDLDTIWPTTINNRGEIVGSGSFKDGTIHNFVLIPVHGHRRVR